VGYIAAMTDIQLTRSGACIKEWNVIIEREERDLHFEG
jgi:hypothetical protein